MTKRFSNLEDKISIEQEMPWKDRDLPTSTFQMLERTAKNYPDRPAISYQLLSGANTPSKTLNWRQFRDLVAQAANLFHSLGIREKDSIAFLLPNSLETAVAVFGGMTAGKVCPINPLLETEQIAALLQEHEAKIVVTLKSFPKTDLPQKVTEAVNATPSVKHVFEVDLNTYLTPPKKWLVPLLRPKKEAYLHANVASFGDALAQQATELHPDIGHEDRIAACFHTGGTTGMPKIAQHRFSGMIYNGWVGHRILYEPEDCMIAPLPLFHVFAVYPVMMAMIASGAHVVFPTPQGYRGEGVFDNFWKLIERWKASYIITVPAAAAALMQRPVDADLSSLKVAFSGSAPFPKELFRRFEEATGVTVVEGYGLTEATCLVSCNPVDGERKVGSVGIALPYTDVRIVSGEGDQSRECATDEIGEICISNPGVIPGGTYSEESRNEGLYYKEKWLRTGDLGRIDDDGYIWITGRAKDLIIRGGHNIDPAIIEEALIKHDAVAMAGAIGQPDAYAGELPAVYVELVEGAKISSEELMKHCNDHIPERAACPKHLEILDELPKTAVGKVFKPDLRKRAISRIYNEALAEAGLMAKVADVIDDKQSGLTAIIEAADEVREDQITGILGRFTRPWVRAQG